MDSLNNLKLRRRCNLVWDNGHPTCVLIVKKPGDAAASQKLQEIGKWCAAFRRPRRGCWPSPPAAALARLECLLPCWPA